MKKFFSRAGILLILVGLGLYSKDQYCKEYPTNGICAVAPAPEPTAVPTVEPTVAPTAQPTAEPTSEPSPEPTLSPEPEFCTIPLNGTPSLSIGLHASNRNVDATPKIANADRCALPEVGYAGRNTCPVCSEGCPQRGICENQLMGGVHPVWELRNGTGNLRIELSEGWFGRLYGNGTGDVVACFPNGKVCSQPLHVSLP